MLFWLADSGPVLSSVRLIIGCTVVWAVLELLVSFDSGMSLSGSITAWLTIVMLMLDLSGASALMLVGACTLISMFLVDGTPMITSTAPASVPLEQVTMPPACAQVNAPSPPAGSLADTKAVPAGRVSRTVTLK